MVSQTFKNEAYAEQSDQASLTLLEVNGSGWAAPLRYTSDGVATTSGGEIYSPLAFRAQLPDRAEGRQPQARIRLDNTDTAALAAIRALQTAPTVNLYVVMAADPDTHEDAYEGMSVVGVDADAGFLDVTLGLEDLDAERFPPRVFDRSWEGVHAS